MSELLPCPFCGNSKQVGINASSGKIQCHMCGIMGPRGDNPHFDAAVAAWNERQSESSLRAELAEANATKAQFQLMADALESFADGGEIGCTVRGAHPGVYECRPESLCVGCRARARFEGVSRELAEAKAALEAALGEWQVRASDAVRYEKERDEAQRELAEAKAELEGAWRNDRPITNDQMIANLEEQLSLCYAIRDGAPPAAAPEPGIQPYDEWTNTNPHARRVLDLGHALARREDRHAELRALIDDHPEAVAGAMRRLRETSRSTLDEMRDLIDEHDYSEISHHAGHVEFDMRAVYQLVCAMHRKLRGEPAAPESPSLPIERVSGRLRWPGGSDLTLCLVPWHRVQEPNGPNPATAEDIDEFGWVPKPPPESPSLPGAVQALKAELLEALRAAHPRNGLDSGWTPLHWLADRLERGGKS